MSPHIVDRGTVAVEVDEGEKSGDGAANAVRAKVRYTTSDGRIINTRHKRNRARISRLSKEIEIEKEQEKEKQRRRTTGVKRQDRNENVDEEGDY